MKGRAKQKQSYGKAQEHLSSLDGRGARTKKTTDPLQGVRRPVLTQSQ